MHKARQHRDRLSEASMCNRSSLGREIESSRPPRLPAESRPERCLRKPTLHAIARSAPPPASAPSGAPPTSPRTALTRPAARKVPHTPPASRWQLAQLQASGRPLRQALGSWRRSGCWPERPRPEPHSAAGPRVVSGGCCLAHKRAGWAWRAPPRLTASPAPRTRRRTPCRCPPSPRRPQPAAALPADAARVRHVTVHVAAIAAVRSGQSAAAPCAPTVCALFCPPRCSVNHISKVCSDVAKSVDFCELGRVLGIWRWLRSGFAACRLAAARRGHGSMPSDRPACAIRAMPIVAKSACLLLTCVPARPRRAGLHCGEAAADI